MFDDELDVFYDEDDFAVLCTRERVGEIDVPFSAILSTLEDTLFESNATLPQHELQYPAAAVDLLPDDVVRTVRTTETGVAEPARVWRVLRSPRHVVDGAELAVFLAPEEG